MQDLKGAHFKGFDVLFVGLYKPRKIRDMHFHARSITQRSWFLTARACKLPALSYQPDRPVDMPSFGGSISVP